MRLTVHELARLACSAERIAQSLLRRVEEQRERGRCAVLVSADEAEAIATDLQLAAEAARALHGFAITGFPSEGPDAE